MCLCMCGALLPPVGQEGHRPLMPMFIRHRAHAGGLHDHIVDNSCEETNKHGVSLESQESGGNERKAES